MTTDAELMAALRTAKAELDAASAGEQRTRAHASELHEKQVKLEAELNAARANHDFIQAAQGRGEAPTCRLCGHTIDVTLDALTTKAEALEQQVQIATLLSDEAQGYADHARTFARMMATRFNEMLRETFQI